MAKSQTKNKSKSSKLKLVPKQKLEKSVLNIKSIASRIPSLPTQGVKLPKIKVKPTLKGTVASLSIMFFVVWIIIGLFIGLLMVQGLKRGVFDNLLFSPAASADSTVQPSSQTDANLPGIGLVNVSCVREALSQETIQKLVESQDVSALNADEKAKLEPCIVEKEEATASPSSDK